MKRRHLLSLALLLGLLSTNAFSYNVVERYKVLHDKFSTYQMLSPIGHDFHLDIFALTNKDILDFVDDADEAAKNADTAATFADQVVIINNFLNEYENTEQTQKISVKLGFPIFSFTMFGIKVKPNFRVHADLGTNIGVRKEAFDVNAALDLLAADIPPLIYTLVSQYWNAVVGSLSQGDNIVHEICTYAVGQGDIPNVNVCDPYRTDPTYNWPGAADVPNVFVMLKTDVKAGFFFDWESAGKKNNKFFGAFNLYALGRADLKRRINQSILLTNSDVIDLGDELNTQINVTGDFKFGYKTKNYSLWGAVEELKFAKASDNIDKAGDLNYGTDPLLRFHGDATVKFIGFTLKPFAGFHKRSGYGFEDGLYGGADLGFHIMGDRFGVMIRGMVDNEHITLAPQIRLWLAQLELMGKVPMSNEKDGVKTASLFAVNLRLFF